MIDCERKPRPGSGACTWKLQPQIVSRSFEQQLYDTTLTSLPAETQIALEALLLTEIATLQEARDESLIQKEGILYRIAEVRLSISMSLCTRSSFRLPMKSSSGM